MVLFLEKAIFLPMDAIYWLPYTLNKKAYFSFSLIWIYKDFMFSKGFVDTGLASLLWTQHQGLHHRPRKSVPKLNCLNTEQLKEEARIRVIFVCSCARFPRPSQYLQAQRQCILKPWKLLAIHRHDFVFSECAFYF